MVRVHAGHDGKGPTVPFGVEIEHHADGPVLRVHGEIDMSTTRPLWAALEMVIGRDEPVVIDLADTTFMDAAGLGVLARASHVDGTKLVVRNPCSLVRTLLSATDVERILVIEGDTRI